MPKFSVVISVYNKEGFIGKTIESVLSQTNQDLEIVIVNDGSTDNSEQEIKSFSDSRIQYIKHPENQGASATRNTAIKATKGTYIALLDGDDVWASTYLNTISLLIQDFPDHSVYATAITIEEHDGARQASYSFSNSENKKHLSLDYFESSLHNTILTSSTTVLRRDIFDTIGWFDTSIKSGQDTDLWIRIGLEYKIAFCIEPHAFYTHTPQSLYKSIGTVSARPTFEKYIPLEKENKGLKKFLDNNRFSLAIRAKLWNEPEAAQRFKNQIHLENLNRKQKFLLKAPAIVVKFLFGFKRLLEKVGLRTSVFR